MTTSINEIRIDQPGGDNDEYFELFGTPNESLDGLTYIVIGDGTGGSGVIEAIIDLDGQSLDENGLFVAAEATFTLGTADFTTDLNFENGDNVTHLLVSGFTGSLDQDLDTDDDGEILMPFTVVDGLALIEEAAIPPTGTEFEYATFLGLPVVGPDGAFVPGQVSRSIDGTGDFQIGAFDPDGGDDTPGVANTEVGGGGGDDPVAASIPEIQGAGHISPLDGQTVTTTGIVTAVDTDGFYFQDPDGDGDAATSDGLFVFTGGAPGVAVGDALEVTGDVSEFIPGGAGTGNLSITQIAFPDTVNVLSSGNPVPEAVVIGASGLVPPTETIISTDELPVNLQDVPGTFNPDTDGIDFYEALEGQLVTVEDAISVGPTDAFGGFSTFEFFVLANQGAGATGLNSNGGITIVDSDPAIDDTLIDVDFNPERVQIDALTDESVLPQIGTGTLLGDITGVVSYSFGNFEVLIDEAPTVTEPTAPLGFAAQLSGDQEVFTVDGEFVPVDTASPDIAHAVLELNEAGDALTYSLTFSAGLDFSAAIESFAGDQMLSPGNPPEGAAANIVTGLHFHDGDDGTNGPVVFGIVGPFHDDDDLEIVVNEDGTTTITGIWEETDPEGAPLSDFVADLEATEPGGDTGLYFNLHTAGFGPGEIRGQVLAAAPGDVTEIAPELDQVTIASYNVLNLEPNEADGDTDIADGRFDAIAAQIVNNLQSPDIIGLQEIQDNDGAADPAGSTVTSADVTLQLLVDAIAAIPDAPNYEFIDNTFIGDDTNGGQPGGNIRTAYLYNPDRVDLVEDSVQSFGSQEPGGAFEGSRLPLVAGFEFNGEEITVINNHFSSRGGSDPLFGGLQPPEVGSADERIAQAQANRDFVNSLEDPENVVILGDLNGFQFESFQAEILAGTGDEFALNNLTDTLDPVEAATFIFNGNSQALDHIFISDDLEAGGFEYDVVSTNINFADTAERASDHDPVITGLTIPVDNLEIGEIQGAGHISPFVDRAVTTTGIVTAIDFNGFYLQDPDGDGDAATSDGIFVFTGDAPTVAVGDALEVTGTVSEFIPGGAPTNNLSITQIGGAEIAVLSSGNELPAAIVLGADGLLPPDEVVISADELPEDGSIQPPTATINLQNAADNAANPFNPDVDGIDFYESLEGLRVTIVDPAAVSATNGFGETWVVTDNGEFISSGSPDGGLNDRGGINLNADADGIGDLNPERIQIQFDGDLLPEGFEAPSITAGDTLSDVTGVVGYAFGNFEVLVTEEFAIEATINTPEVTELVPGDEELTVATYNVLNLTSSAAIENGVTDPDADQREALADQIINNLGSPDIIALQEIQDNDGVEGGDNALVTDGTQTLQELVDAIAAAGGPTYEFFDVFAAAPEEEFVNTQGGVPSGNIRNAFLYNPERVTLEGTEALTPAELTAAGIPNADIAFVNDVRVPLVGTFGFEGEEITLINNHLTSRFGSSPIFGSLQPFIQAGEVDRELQTQALNDYVDFVLAENPDENVVVLGDLNTFDFTNDLAEILPGVGDEQVLTNLVTEVLPGDEASTFIFQGNSQVLDHIFVTDGLLEVAEADIVHVNNDFPEFASDHEPVLASFALGADVDPDPDPDPVGPQDGLVVASPEADDLVGGLDVTAVANTILTGAGDDSVDLAFASGEDIGGNIVLAGSGTDEVSVTAGDIVSGGSGDDTFFAEDSLGGNRVAGGAGEDTFFLGAASGDTFLGGADDDTFFFDESEDNFISGGSGIDTFFLPGPGDAPAAANSITDFDVAADLFAGVGFDAVTFDGSDVLVDGDVVATLIGVDASTLTAANFA